MKPRGIVFVSCGQRTAEERALGSKICELINATDNLTGYFAQDESTLEGLTGNIFMRLDKCVALVMVMHRRGRVAVPEMPAFDRASVFVEQEIGIAAFLKHVGKRPIEVRAYVEEGVALEGMREHLQLNPVHFAKADEILTDLKGILPGWGHLLPKAEGPLEVEMELKKNVGRTPGGGRMEDRLVVSLANVGQETVPAFVLRIVLPKGFVENPHNYMPFDRERSDEKTDCFRFTEKSRRETIRPGDRPPPFEFNVSAEGLPPANYEASATVQVDRYPSVTRTIKLT